MRKDSAHPASDVTPYGKRLPQNAPLSKYKVVFLGEQGTGKTSIIKTFVRGTFDPVYSATVGIDFLSRTICLDDRTVRLQIWDSAGQERFRTLIPSYIRDSSVAVIVYDITNRATFHAVDYWVDYVRVERGNNVLILIVGNKIDLEDKRAVTTEEGEEKAKKHKAEFLECSAKKGAYIKTLFRTIASTVPNESAAPPAADNNLIDIKLQAVPPKSESESSNCAC